MLWQVKRAAHGTLATAGGLVFTGEANGHFNAYDAAKSRTLSTHQTGVNVGAPPMSYAVNGRQFVAVATAMAACLRAGGAIMAFPLSA